MESTEEAQVKLLPPKDESLAAAFEKLATAARTFYWEMVKVSKAYDVLADLARELAIERLPWRQKALIYLKLARWKERDGGHQNPRG